MALFASLSRSFSLSSKILFLDFGIGSKLLHFGIKGQLEVACLESNCNVTRTA